MIEDLQIPVLMIVHDFGDLCRLADHVVYLSKGRVIASGKLAQTLLDPSLPFYLRDDACIIVEAIISNHDSEFALSQLNIGDHNIQIPTVLGQKGSPVRLRIRASDVSISREQATNSSIINTLAVKAVEIRENINQPGQKTVILSAGSLLLLARLTTKSIHDLNLKLGDQVYARIKASAALLY
jgi:molybdate transport system ATP-binding protein